MGGQAEKKAKANSVKNAAILNPIFYSIQCVYALSLWFNGVYLEFWVLLWFAGYFYTGNFLRKQMISQWERGLEINNTLDVFGVVTLSQLASMFSNLGGWLSLALIPAYLCYQYGGMILGFCCRGSKAGESTEGGEGEEKRYMSKRQQKLEKRGE